MPSFRPVILVALGVSPPYFINNTVWHYSNTKDEVVSQDISAFKKHYSGTQYAVFWGSFPK